MSAQNGAGGDVGLVLGGGGARGAYASGALSVLLPELKDQVSVIVGTSAGALISAYLAANWHRPAEEAIEDGLRFWRELRFGDVLAPLMAPGGAARFIRYVGEFLPVSSLHAPSILNPEPLAQTLAKLVDFDQLGENIREQRLALGVVATPAYSNRSVVFHQGGIPRHRDDPLRGIEYVATPRAGRRAYPRLLCDPGAVPGRARDRARAGGRLVLRRWPAPEHADQAGAVAGSQARDRDRAQLRRPEPHASARAAAQLLRRRRAPAARRARRPARPGHPHARQHKRADRSRARRALMDALATTAPPRASASRGGAGRSRSQPVPYIFIAPEDPVSDRRDRPPRVPQALPAPLEGRRARSVAAGKDPRRRRRRDARRAAQLRVLRRRIRRSN